jgi:hypothetical protein
MIPLSDTARAIQVLDREFGAQGWRLVSSGWETEHAVWVLLRGRSLSFEFQPTARDAILAAARVQTETQRSAA